MARCDAGFPDYIEQHASQSLTRVMSTLGRLKPQRIMAQLLGKPYEPFWLTAAIVRFYDFGGATGA